MIFFLPALAGTIVDRYGFKKSLLACFSIFCLGYLLIGLAGLPAGQPLVAALGGPKTYMILALLITAIGGSLIKPCIVGTVARTTNQETKSLGYSIYYTLVNLGGAIGPTLALLVRQNLGIAYVLVMSFGHQPAVGARHAAVLPGAARARKMPRRRSRWAACCWTW